MSTISRLAGLAALAFLAGAAFATVTPTSATPLELARSLVESVRPEDTSYRHKQGSVAWKGFAGATKSESHTDCSGLINAILGRSYGYDAARFTAWLGKARPLAVTYHEAIVRADGFDKVERVDDIQPGDIVAIRYPDGSDDTGHIVIVASRPRKGISPRRSDFAAAWDLDVIDSSRSGHGKTDTRRRPDGSLGGGVGMGTMRVYADAAGAVSGYAWSTLAASEGYGQAERPLVIGRLTAERTKR